MKGLLRKALCLALGLAPASAYSQELNFRAVAPRRTVSADPIPISLSQPVPMIEPTSFVARGKGIEDAPVLVQDSGGKADAPKLIAPPAPARTGIPRPMPLGPGEFIAPPPSIAGKVSGPIVSAPGDGQIQTVVPHVVSNGPIITDAGGSCCTSTSDVVVGGDACCDGCGMCTTGCGLGSWWQDCRNRLGGIFDPCNACCGPRNRFWVRGEYLIWGISQQRVPPLVTMSPDGNPLNLPLGTGIVTYGGNDPNNQTFNGGRISAGFWFPNHDNWGLDASYFALGQRHGNYFAASNGLPGSPAIGRPTIEFAPGAPFFGVPTQVAETTAALGVPGSINVQSNTQLWGADMNLRRKLWCGQTFWIDGLIGYRHLELRESISIAENIGPVLINGVPSMTTVYDRFGTLNTFNGGQIGLDGEWRFRPRWTLGFTGKLAAGNMHQLVVIEGQTTQAALGGPVFSQPGGLLALPSNIGRHNVDRFAVIPEFGLRVGFDVTDHLRVFAGYNILYVSSVVRPGEQIDRRVNSTQFPFSGPPLVAPGGGPPGGAPGVLVGSPVPAVLFKTSEFWAQGVNFGLEYHY